MQILPHQAMGYDRAITIFSPDGRLLQVEYAKKAVSAGAIALGIVCKDAVVIAADKHKADHLLVLETIRKIFELDKHVAAAAAGIMADARILVKSGRNYAQQHRMTYGEPIDVEGVVKHVADIKQAYTQYGGIRPFGISMLIGGQDKKGAHLFVTDPTGTYFSYKAKAIGAGASEADKLLASRYKDNMKEEDGCKLAQSILKKVLKKEYNKDRIECLIVRKNGVESVKVM